MLLKKILHTTTILAALGVLLGSACPNAVWAMDAQESLPIETISHIVQYRAKIEKDCGEAGKRMVSDWNNLCNYRLVSHLWRRGTDEVIKKENLFTLALTPKNYTSPLLERMASLTSTVHLAGWSQDNSRFIENALPQEFFAHLSKLSLIESDALSSRHSLSIGDEGVNSFGSALKALPQLKSLTFGMTMSEDVRKNLVNSLPCLTQLEDLSLITPLSVEGSKDFGKILPSLTTTLQSLELWGMMGPLGTKKFTKGLSSLQTLKILHIEHNGIGDIGIVALADQLKHLPQLEALYLVTNGASPKTPGGESRFVREAGEQYFLEKVKKYKPNLKYSLGK